MTKRAYTLFEIDIMRDALCKKNRAGFQYHSMQPLRSMQEHQIEHFNEMTAVEDELRTLMIAGISSSNLTDHLITCEKCKGTGLLTETKYCYVCGHSGQVYK